MKVIFLDIDGVLNNEIWFLSKESRGHDKQINGKRNNKRWFDPRCVSLLNDLTETLDLKIVLSSTWRIGRDKDSLQELFNQVGIKGELIGKTKSSEEGIRGVEIYSWLNENKKVEDYVILDDDSDMLMWQREHFFKVDPYCGLSPNVCYRIKNYINKIAI